VPDNPFTFYSCYLNVLQYHKYPFREYVYYQAIKRRNRKEF